MSKRGRDTARRVVDRLVANHDVGELEAAGLVKRILGSVAAESVIRDHRDSVLEHTTYAGLVAGNVLERRARHRYAEALEVERRARLDALMGDLVDPSPDPAQLPVDELLTASARAKVAAANGASPQGDAQVPAPRTPPRAEETR